jgi:hypothetical protein
MVTIAKEKQIEFENFLSKNNLSEFAKPIGKITEKKDFCVKVIE